MRVEVIDLKTGKSKFMPDKHAKVLVKLKRARWPEPAGNNFFDRLSESVTQMDEIRRGERSPSREFHVDVDGADIKVSKAAKALAESSGIDILQVVGTGKDGAVTKPDVQAFIDAKPKE